MKEKVGLLNREVQGVECVDGAVLGALGLPPVPSRILREGLDLVLRERELWLEVLTQEQGRRRIDVDREWETLARVLPLVLESHPGPEWEPRGVAAILLSSVWPLYHSVLFAFSALRAGCPVILKPSENAPQSVWSWVERLRAHHTSFQALQCLVGDREVGRRLACHERIDTVAFMGSFENGMRVRQDTLARPSKEVLLHLGNRNVAVLSGVGVPEDALERILESAFAESGQDCKSTAMLFVPEGQADLWMKRIQSRIEQMRPLDPLTDPARLDRFLKWANVAEREGGRVILRGKPQSGNAGSGSVSPSVVGFPRLEADSLRRSVALQTEVLGPLLGVIGYRDPEHLVSMLGALHHAHTCSLFGADLPDPGVIPFSRVLRNQTPQEADPSIPVHYRKRNGNHALLGVALPLQFMCRTLKC